MAFTAGIKKPQQSGSGYNKKTVYDRLVTVTGYDINKAEMYAEDAKGKKYRVYISPEEVVKTDAAIAAKGTDVSKVNWMGHKIDKGMEKNIKVGHQCALVRSSVSGTDKTTGVTDLEVNRIKSFPSQKAGKIFQGIISMSYRVDDGVEKVNRIYHWSPKGLDFDLANDLKSLHELSGKIDIARKNYGQKIGETSITEPSIGVQFRSLMKTDKEYQYPKEGEPKEIWEVIDVSQPFDWLPGPDDESGKQIKAKAENISGEKMIEFAEMYYNYITESERFKEFADQIKFEACWYESYPATQSDELRLTTGDKEKDRNSDKNPLYQMCHRKSYGDIENSEQGLIVGKNAAVNGIVGLSEDKLLEVNDQPVKVPSNWVNKVFANNIRGHVHAFVRTSDGAKCEVHKSLELIRTDLPANAKTEDHGNSQNSAQTNKQGQQSQPHQELVTQKLSEPSASPMDEEFNPFMDDAASEAPAVAPRVSFGKKSS